MSLNEDSGGEGATMPKAPKPIPQETQPSNTGGMGGIGLNVQCPDKFNFTIPAGWPQWKKRFDRYMSVSGLSQKTDAEKIDILRYLMGEESEQIVAQWKTKPTTYQRALDAFEKHFIPSRNVIFERFKFNSRVQQPGESVDQFINSLHALSDFCEFGNLREELIRDRIVIGMFNKRTSERFQLQAKLTLQEAILAARQAKMLDQQGAILRPGPGASSEEVRVMSKSKARESVKSFPRKADMNKSEMQPHIEERCYFCEKETPEERCPARRVTCSKCKKVGQWHQVCKSVRYVNINDVNEGKDENSDEDERCNFFVGGIFAINTLYKDSHVDKEIWTCLLKVEGFNNDVKFLIDSGANITCLSEGMLPTHLVNQVRKCNEIISGSDGKRLNIVGKLKLKLTYSNNEMVCDVYILKNLQLPIIGRSAIVHLKIIKFAGCISRDNSVSVDMIIRDFPNLFANMGELQGEIEIKIKPDAVPFVQTAPRTVPIPLLKKLENELSRLQKLKIIVPVEEPTTWVASIVVVPKGEGIRLCCDYTKLDRSVLGPHFPIPKIETTLAKLKGW